MYQIIITQWGLSLGEVETINNLFKDYSVIEKPIQQSVDYASNFEIEFAKNKNIDFFNCISIEKWTVFVDIIKNIKKRRGKKGLKFKATITDYIEPERSENYDNTSHDGKNDDIVEIKNEIELLFFKKTIFLLIHKNDSEFNKGLERIEIMIENLTDFYKRISLSESSKYPDIEGNLMDENKIKENKIRQTEYAEKSYKNEKEIDMSIFIFDDKKRIWKNL